MPTKPERYKRKRKSTDGDHSQEGNEWLPYEEKLLGTDYDRIISAQLRRSTSSVSLKRRALKILAYGRGQDR